MRRNRTFRQQAVALLLLILLAGTSGYFWTHVSEPAAGRPESPDKPRASARPQVFYGPGNSLAVLPFHDSSPGRHQAPQALAFSADLLDRFIEVPGLQVTARNSAFFFRDGNVEPRAVAERLQSAHLLKGYWRREGDRLDVSVSLFDARANRETWRQDYEQPFAGLPDLPERIVTEALQALSVSGPAEGRAPRVADAAAWTDYAEGLYHADPFGRQDLPSAAAAFQSAIDRDPGFAAARLALAELRLHPEWNPQAGAAPVEEARVLIRQVLDGDPQSARALGLLSYIRHQYDWDWRGAAAAGRQAVAAQPGNAVVLGVASLASSTIGDFEQAQAWLEEAIRRDPLNLGTRLSMGLLQEFTGDFDGALSSYRQVLAFHPEYPAARAYRARVKALQGKADSALRESEQESSPFWRRYARILALQAGGPSEEASALLQSMIAEDGEVASFQLAEIMAFGGDTEEALAWLQRARERRDPGMAALLGNPLLQSLHDDARWAELLRDLGLAIDSSG